MHMKPQMFYIFWLLLSLLQYVQGDFTLNSTTITNITIANVWDDVGAEFYTLYVKDNNDSDIFLAFTSYNYYEYQIEPNVEYRFSVHSSDSDESTTNSITFVPSLPRFIETLDSYTAVFIFQDFQSGLPGVFILQRLEFQNWTVVSTIPSLEITDAYYSINVQAKSTQLYRLYREPQYSSAFWYIPPPQIYPDSNLGSVSSRPIRGILSNTTLSSDEKYYVQFPITGRLPQCVMTSARLILNFSADSMPGGVIRVFEENETNPLYYFSSDDNQKIDDFAAYIPLDRVTPTDLLNQLTFYNSTLSNFKFRIELFGAIFSNNLQIDDAILEIAFENTFMSITQTNLNFTLPRIPDDIPKSPPTIISAPQEVLDQFFDKIIISVEVEMKGIWTDGIISAGISNSAIGSKRVSASSATLTLTSNYSIIEGGFVMGNNSFYIIFEPLDTAPFLSFEYIHATITHPIGPIDICATTPTISSTPTRTNPSTPSLSPLPSILSSPLPSSSPTITPSGVNISPPLGFTESPSSSLFLDSVSTTISISASTTPITIPTFTPTTSTTPSVFISSTSSLSRSSTPTLTPTITSSTTPSLLITFSTSKSNTPQNTQTSTTTSTSSPTIIIIISNTPSISFSLSTVSLFPVASPLKSENMQGPSLETKTPTISSLPIPLFPSSSPSMSPQNVIEVTPQIQETKMPINQETITIL